jgi:hypothetical protein
MKRILLATFVALVPATAHSQIQMVCQTPQFWCGFMAPFVAPNGYPCHCNTMYGPIAGFSINPNGPTPQSPYPPPSTPPQVPTPQPTGGGGAPSKNDCFKGLGNCGGAFAN